MLSVHYRLLDCGDGVLGLQSVEQGTENPRVGDLGGPVIPPLATINLRNFSGIYRFHDIPLLQKQV